MNRKTVSPAAEVPFDHRRKEAQKVLLAHFPKASEQAIDDWSLLLASKLSTWGEIVPTVTYNQKDKLVSIIKDLDRLSSDAPYWLKKELRAAQKILNAALTAHRLHGLQNKNEMAAKVQLVNMCRQIWYGQHEKEPPITFQKITHPFSKFVGDVIDDVFLKDWSIQSAIEAYKNYK
jgi:hypothetical protein